MNPMKQKIRVMARRPYKLEDFISPIKKYNITSVSVEKNLFKGRISVFTLKIFPAIIEMTLPYLKKEIHRAVNGLKIVINHSTCELISINIPKYD